MAASYAYFPYIIKNAQPINAGHLPASALGARALGPRTLEVHLEHPAPYLLEMLTHTSMMPLPRHVVEAKGKYWTTPSNYVGNGAFMLKEWIPNDHITAISNPRFYDAANVKLEQVIYYPTDDYAAGFRRLRGGELDATDRLENNQFGWIKKNMPELLAPVPQLIMDMVAGQSHQETVRQYPGAAARINLAINREAITDRITRWAMFPPIISCRRAPRIFPAAMRFDFRSMPYPARTAEAQKADAQGGLRA